MAPSQDSSDHQDYYGNPIHLHLPLLLGGGHTQPIALHFCIIFDTVWAASRCWCLGVPLSLILIDHPKQTRNITNLRFKNISSFFVFIIFHLKTQTPGDLPGHHPRHFLQPLGYQLILTGHSLGAGTACCLAKILHDRFLGPQKEGGLHVLLRLELWGKFVFDR